MQELLEISTKFNQIVKKAQGIYEGGIKQEKSLTQMTEEMSESCMDLFQLMGDLEKLKIEKEYKKASEELYSSIECVRESFIIDTSTIMYPEPSMVNLSDKYMLKAMDHSLEYEKIMENKGCSMK
jgi:hypothetical protein